MLRVPERTRIVGGFVCYSEIHLDFDSVRYPLKVSDLETSTVLDVKKLSVPSPIKYFTSVFWEERLPSQVSSGRDGNTTFVGLQSSTVPVERS